MAKTSEKYNYTSALIGFTVWGGWAYYVNYSDSDFTGLISGITQGIASFIMTLAVVLVVTKIYNKIKNDTLKIVLPAVVTVTCMCTLLIAIHTFIGTPHILYTIVPSISVAFIFCIVTAYSLRKNEIEAQA